MNKQDIKMGERYRFSVYGHWINGTVIQQNKTYQWRHTFKVTVADAGVMNFNLTWVKNQFKEVPYEGVVYYHVTVDSKSVLVRLNNEGKASFTKAQQAQRAKTFNAAYKRQTKKEADKLALNQAVAKLQMIGIDAWEASAQRSSGKRYLPTLMVSASDCNTLSEAIDTAVKQHIKEIMEMNEDLGV